MDDPYWECKVCDAHITIIFTNIPGLDVEFCPLCGGEREEVLEFHDEELD